MNRIIRIVVGTIVSVPAVNVPLGLGVASAAPPYYGQTYAKAAAAIASYGAAIKIETVIGGDLATDDCIVINARPSKTANAWILNLDCTHGVAGPGRPGHSITTPLGRDAMKRQDESDFFNRDTNEKLAAGKVPWCGTHVDYCIRVCDLSDMCSKEVLNYLAKLS